MRVSRVDSCDTFAWSRACIGWRIGNENYSSWFGRNEHGMRADDWASLSAALAASSMPAADLAHAVWNFGCTLFQLRAHRRLELALS